MNYSEFSKVKLKPQLNKSELEYYFRLKKDGDFNARQKIIEHNIRLVLFCARKYMYFPFDMEDLVSVGMIGLVKSVDNFNIDDKRSSYANYALHCINNEIISYIKKNSKHIDNISLCEIVEDEISLEETLSIDEDFTQELENKECLDILKQIVEELPDNEKNVIKMYFGFLGDPKKQTYIASVLNTSQPSIVRITKRALEHLRTKLCEQNIVSNISKK